MNDMHYDDQGNIRFDASDVTNPSPALRRRMREAADALEKVRLDARIGVGMSEHPHTVDPTTQPCVCYQGAGSLRGQCVCMRSGVRSDTSVDPAGWGKAWTVPCSAEEAEADAKTRTDAAPPLTVSSDARTLRSVIRGITDEEIDHVRAKLTAGTDAMVKVSDVEETLEKMRSTRTDAIGVVERAIKARDERMANAWRTDADAPTLDDEVETLLASDDVERAELVTLAGKLEKRLAEEEKAEAADTRNSLAKRLSSGTKVDTRELHRALQRVRERLGR